MAAASPTMPTESAVTTSASASASSAMKGLSPFRPRDSPHASRRRRRSLAQAWRRAARQRRHERIAALREPVELCREGGDIGSREAVIDAVAADEERDARAREAREDGERLGAGRGQFRRRDPMRRERRLDHIGSAEGVVLGNPDEIRGSHPGVRVLHEGREGAPGRLGAHTPDIRDGAPAGSDDEVGVRRRDRALRPMRGFLRVDGPERRRPAPRRSRRDLVKHGRKAERLDHTEADGRVPGLAVRQHPGCGRGRKKRFHALCAPPSPACWRRCPTLGLVLRGGRLRAFVDFNNAPHPPRLRLHLLPVNGRRKLRYAPITLAGSTFTPGPMVEEMAMRCT